MRKKTKSTFFIFALLSIISVLFILCIILITINLTFFSELRNIENKGGSHDFFQIKQSSATFFKEIQGTFVSLDEQNNKLYILDEQNNIDVLYFDVMTNFYHFISLSDEKYQEELSAFYQKNNSSDKIKIPPTKRMFKQFNNITDLDLQKEDNVSIPYIEKNNKKIALNIIKIN